MLKQQSLFDEENVDEREEIILSLQEQYFEKILHGVKKNEYRFSFIKNESKAYIYLPKNKQQIAGIVYLGIPVWCNSADAANIYENSGDGEYKVMKEWLKDRKGCYVIPIEGYKRFDIPITKDELQKQPEFIAPQTYLLLKNRPTLKSFLNKAEDKEKEEMRGEAHVR